MAYSLGLDIGSSSVKASIVDLENGNIKASGFYPKQEMEIIAQKEGWAEQEPSNWWSNLKIIIKELLDKYHIEGNNISFIGISYQMHGLVAVDKKGKVLRPSIIWCDSRAVETGNKAFKELGPGILDHSLNSPGNFTASKLKWVKENEPEIYKQIHKIMLPGDYIAYKLTGEINTTISGLSEGIMWDFKENTILHSLLDHYGIDKDLIPPLVDTFSNQGKIMSPVAEELGLSKDAIVSYRAGDQPNNALSLNVLEAGELAATAGTSGVVYGISDVVKYDRASRVNTFAHVNHSSGNTRLGVLLAINGTGIMNSWLRKNIATDLSYEEMNREASAVKSGSNGLMVFPYGNGAERMFGNLNTGAGIWGLNLNIHSRRHMLRAAQEAIAFSFRYGMEILKENGINTSVIRAGHSNMFLSPIFRESLANITGTTIELFDTDGSVGAARGAAYGSGYYKSLKETMSGLEKIKTVEPTTDMELEVAYNNWETKLKEIIKY